MKRPDGAISDGADELDESLLPKFGGSAGAEPNATNQPTNQQRYEHEFGQAHNVKDCRMPLDSGASGTYAHSQSRLEPASHIGVASA